MADSYTLVLDLLSKTGGRDKLMSLIQFVPTLLSGPTAALGGADAATRMLKLADLADKYRSVTRMFGLFDATSPAAIARLSRERDPTLSKLGAIEWLLTLAFFAAENLAVLASAGITTPSPARAAQYGPLCVFFWWYGLTVGIVGNCYRLFVLKPRSPQEQKALRVSLVKSAAFWVFALSCLPKDSKPQLQEVKGGVLSVAHALVEMLTPPAITLSAPAKGLLGTIATACDFV